MTNAVLSLKSSLPPVRDQALRGTCVAFVLTCGHERERYGGADGASLSEEALHWATSQVDPRPGDSTSLAHGAQALARSGQPEASVWPYISSGAPRPPPAGCFDRAFRANAEPLQNVSVASLREALNDSAVVCAGIPIWPEFMRATIDRSDVIAFADVAKTLKPSHAVALVGHDPGRRAVLVRNSWGESWGSAGYGWVDHDVVSYCSSMWRVTHAHPREE